MSRLLEDPFNELHMDGIRVSAIFLEIEYALYSYLDGGSDWIAGTVDVQTTFLSHKGARDSCEVHSKYHPFDSQYDLGR